MSTRRQESFEKLLAIIETLRGPDGCPWDRKQTRRDVAQYLLDETYETIDAIHRKGPGDLREELGDVLFQILFLARIAEESGEFDIAGVIDGIREKMIRRHPHVFENARVSGVEEVKENWKRIKMTEQNGSGTEDSSLSSIPASLPSLQAAWLLTRKAADAGFDWESAGGVIDKIDEEVKELRKALAEGSRDAIADETGDLLFSLVNFCRFTGTHPETALASSVARFRKRFAFIEAQLKKRGVTPREATLEEMDRLWEAAKRDEEKST